MGAKKTRGSCGFIIFLAPTFADQDMLPQTAAFVMETFRWRPVSAGGRYIYIIYISNVKFIGIDKFGFLGFAHKATKDIFWVGFSFCVYP